MLVDVLFGRRAIGSKLEQGMGRVLTYMYFNLGGGGKPLLIWGGGGTDV